MERNGNPWNLSAARPHELGRAGWTCRRSTTTPTSSCSGGWAVRRPMTRGPSRRPRPSPRCSTPPASTTPCWARWRRCTGDAARRSGNEALFFEMARANIETLNEVWATRSGASSPPARTACRRWARSTAQYGGHYEVIHHTQLLSELTAAKKISVERATATVDMITFHDPCYLGRQNGIVDAPRDAAAGHGRLRRSRCRATASSPSAAAPAARRCGRKRSTAPPPST